MVFEQLFGPKGSGIGRIDISSPNRAQPSRRKPKSMIDSHERIQGHFYNFSTCQSGQLEMVRLCLISKWRRLFLQPKSLMSEKLIYVLSSFHMLFCAFGIHIHVKLIKFPLNLVL